MSTTEQSKPSWPQQRPPAPTLFVGPPAQEVPSAELRTPPSPVPQSAATRLPLLRERSARNDQTQQQGSLSDASPSSANDREPTLQQQERVRKQKWTPPAPDTTEATWAAMQSTLEEVELSSGNRTNTFGAEHSRALEELRNAQIALAQAWARSAGDDALEGDGVEVQWSSDSRSESRSEQGAGKEGSAKGGKNGAMDGGVGPGAAGMLEGDRRGRLGQMRTQLEEETERDILLARRRREANDKYFERVNRGVVDVVAKLQEVAAKMSSVEMESQEIWGDRDTLSSDSTT